MNLKIEITLGQYRRHTRDESFNLADMRRDLVFYSNENNVLKLKIKRRDHWYCTFDVDITGWAFDFIVKNNPTDPDIYAVINKHVDIFTEPTEGEADIDITAPSGIEYLGNYIYQLQRTDKEGKKDLLIEGIISFKQTLFGE